MEGVLGHKDAGFDLANGEKPCGLDYADEIAHLFESTDHAQCAPD